MKGKNLLKKTVVLTVALAIAVGAAACGSKKDDESKSKKTYVVGTEPTFAPFDTTDADGNIVGFDMDLMKAIGKNQGFEVKFKSFGFDALIPSVNAKNCDIIAAGMTANEDRVKKVDLVIVGEGRMDQQSLAGKAPIGVAKRTPSNIPVIAICGSLSDNLPDFPVENIQAAFPIISQVEPLAITLAKAEENLIRTAQNIGNLLKMKI